MQKSWFAVWFDTPYYHLLYKNRNEEEAALFIDTICDYFKIDAATKVLDLACGKGRHSVYINKKTNCFTTGYDLSNESITAALVHSNPKLDFAVHDMRQPFGANRFDIVLNLFTSFGYFNHHRTNNKVIKNINVALDYNGFLIIDFINVLPLMQLNSAPEISKLMVDTICFNTTKKIENNIIIKQIEVIDNGVKHHFEERLQCLTFIDFKNIIATTNFEIIDVFGDYSFAAYDESKSSRLIIIAKKTGE